MKIWKALYECSCLFVVGWLKRMAENNVTLAFEDAQVIPLFSMEETDDRDDRYDKDDRDDIGDRDDRDDRDDTDDRDDRDDTG